MYQIQHILCRSGFCLSKRRTPMSFHSNNKQNKCWSCEFFCGERKHKVKPLKTNKKDLKHNAFWCFCLSDWVCEKGEFAPEGQYLHAYRRCASTPRLRGGCELPQRGGRGALLCGVDSTRDTKRKGTTGEKFACGSFWWAILGISESRNPLKILEKSAFLQKAKNGKKWSVFSFSIRLSQHSEKRLRTRGKTSLKLIMWIRIHKL